MHSNLSYGCSSILSWYGAGIGKDLQRRRSMRGNISRHIRIRISRSRQLVCLHSHLRRWLSLIEYVTTIEAVIVLCVRLISLDRIGTILPRPLHKPRITLPHHPPQSVFPPFATSATHCSLSRTQRLEDAQLPLTLYLLELQ